jgi:hypothetical protein
LIADPLANQMESAWSDPFLPSMRIQTVAGPHRIIRDCHRKFIVITNPFRIILDFRQNPD